GECRSAAKKGLAPDNVKILSPLTQTGIQGHPGGRGQLLAMKVLIADDSPLVLRMIEKMLSAAGFSVVTARDGLEAIEKAVSEDVQLVILDVTMPRMNGYQACRLLKTEPTTRDLPV